MTSAEYILLFVFQWTCDLSLCNSDELVVFYLWWCGKRYVRTCVFVRLHSYAIDNDWFFIFSIYIYM